MHTRRQFNAALVAAAASSLTTLFSRTNAEGAPCMLMGLRPFVWTPRDTALPPDGAIVLSLETEHSGSFMGGGSFFDRATPVLRDERGALAFETRAVSPSLRLLVPRRPARGRVTVTGLAGSQLLPAAQQGRPVVVRFDGRAGPALAAPVLGAVRQQEHLSSGPRGSSRSSSLNAVLTAPVPADAAFVLLYAAATPNGTAMLDAPANAAAMGLLLHHTGGRCGPPNPGSPPGVGQSVVLRYVDRFGRLSPPSNAVSVTA